MDIFAVIGMAFIAIMILLFFSFIKKRNLLKKNCRIINNYYELFDEIENQGIQIYEDDRDFIFQSCKYWALCDNYLQDGEQGDLSLMIKQTNEMIDSLNFIFLKYKSKVESLIESKKRGN